MGNVKELPNCYQCHEKVKLNYAAGKEFYVCPKCKEEVNSWGMLVRPDPKPKPIAKLESVPLDIPPGFESYDMDHNKDEDENLKSITDWLDSVNDASDDVIAMKHCLHKRLFTPHPASGRVDSLCFDCGAVV